MTVKSKSKKIADGLNPYPGLRPFTREEAHLFFGREGQVDDVVDNLIKQKFVAVIGSSGSGKSSLIYCGVLSKVVEKGKWNLIVSRPGTNPFQNLADSVYEALGKEKIIGKDDAGLLLNTEALLKKDYHSSKAANLIVIDQFEELFRYKTDGESEKVIESQSKYVNFLVDLVKQTEVPVYIIITMRSDFIGECSRFQKFTSLINRSSYLIPRMSRENFRTVIEEPAKIFGARINEKLVEILLNELGDNQDQLPILQHALMRTWNHWRENSSEENEITQLNYYAVGGLKRALSDHANEAYNELSDEEKKSCEKIFRTLTEKGMDNRGVRRPTKLSVLALISETTEKQVIKILNTFRAKGRSFITPSFVSELDNNSMIDLSHEALMRIWDRLNIWVEEEATAVAMYRRLADSAANYQIGKTGLWRPPDLQLAINWRNKTRPNLFWAKRHDPAFERTIVFLNTSQEDFEREENNKIRLQKQRLRRSKSFALVLGTVAIISLVLFLWTRQLSVNLEQQIIIAENERNLAQQKSEEAEEQRIIAQDNLGQAQIERQRADTAAMLAEDRRLDAVQSAQEAALQTNLAQKNLITAKTATELAKENEQKATEQQMQAEVAREEAFTRRMLSISNSLAVKSSQLNSSKNLKSLLAQQAYLFNNKFGGKTFDVDIYNALYSSLKSLKGQGYNIFTGHNNAVRSIRFVKGSSSFYSAGSDGRILKWNLNVDSKEYATILEGRKVIEKIALSSDGSFLLAAENRAGLLFLDLRSGPSTEIVLPGIEKNIRTIAISPDDNRAYTAGLDNVIEVWNLNNKTSAVFSDTDSRINSLSISPNGKILAGGSKDGKTIIWQTDGNKLKNEIYNDPSDIVQSVRFSSDGKYLACGTIKGNIRIFRADNFEIITILSGHSARVTDIDFSPKSEHMVSTSYDNKVLFWNIKDLTSPPVVFNDNSGFVFAVSFSGDGKYFVSGSAEEARLVVRPSSTQLMSKEICPLIERNLNKDEWNTYVGKDIKYVKTCAGK